MHSMLSEDPEERFLLEELQRCYPYDGLSLDPSEAYSNIRTDMMLNSPFFDYYDFSTLTLEELENELHNDQIQLSRDQILEDYGRLQDLNELSDQYLSKYEDDLEDGTGEGQELLLAYLERLVKEHISPAETGDLSCLMDMIDDFEEADYKKIPQEDIETVYRGLITYAKKHGILRLSDIEDLFLYQDFPMRAIKACHNRNNAFRSLIREFYETFEDADPKIFPAVYKEFKASSRKK